MTTPTPSSAIPQAEDLAGLHIENLRTAAAEIRAEQHNGWGNACEDAADAIDRLTRERDEAREKLQDFALQALSDERQTDEARATSRASTLEEAAKVCESLSPSDIPGDPFATAMSEAAEAIRELVDHKSSNVSDNAACLSSVSHNVEPIMALAGEVADWASLSMSRAISNDSVGSLDAQEKFNAAREALRTAIVRALGSKGDA